MNWINVKDKLPEFNQKVIAGLSVFCPFQQKIITYSYDVGTYCCTEEWKLQYYTTERQGKSGFKLDVRYWANLPKIEIKE
jgi:hypothetical protein